MGLTVSALQLESSRFNESSVGVWLKAEEQSNKHAANNNRKAFFIMKQV